MASEFRKNNQNYNILRFNLVKFISLSAFGPFEIYSFLYLSETADSRIILGAIMIAALLLGTGFDPVMGGIIDRHSRKWIMDLIMAGWVLSSIAAFLIWMVFPHMGNYIIPGLFLWYDFSGGAFFSVMRSLQQTISDRRSLGRNNSFSEISGQLPSIIGAGMAIPVLEFIGIRWSLMLSVFFLIVAIMVLHGLHEEFDPAGRRDNIHGRAENTLGFLRKNPYTILFFYLLNFTFIMVTVDNLLKPMFIVESLHGSAASISLSEITYATFGCITGIVMSVLSVKFTIRHCYAFMTIFMAGSFLIPFSGVFYIYILFQSFHGIGNPGNRISRNTIAMTMVHPSDSGKFFGGIEFLSNITRIALLVAFTILVNITGPGFLIEITGFIMVGTTSVSLLIYRAIAKGGGFLRKEGHSKSGTAGNIG